MLKITLKSTVSSFIIYLSILLPISAMLDDDSNEYSHVTAASESSEDWEKRYQHAKALELGRGVERNIDEAKEIYKDLINGTTNVRANLRLGMLYEKDRNFTEALKNYEEAWRLDGYTNQKAGMKCADFYEKGLGTKQNLSQALRIFSGIASSGQNNAYKTEATYKAEFIWQFNPELRKELKPYYQVPHNSTSKEAQFLMGCAKRFNPDKTEAINYFKQSSAQGYFPAQLALMEMALKGHIDGQGEEDTFTSFQGFYQNVFFKQQWTSFFNLSEPQNVEEAFQLFKIKINTGAIEAMLANIFYATKDYRQHINHLRIASAKGHRYAMFQFGLLYEKGSAIIAPAPTFASCLFIQAAQKGNVQAMLKMAEVYKHGRGIPKSFSKAFTWLRRAALAGHPEAINTQKEFFCFLLPESLRVDYEGDFNPHDHDMPVIVSLYNNPNSQQAMTTHWNTLLNSPNRVEMRDISSFIIENCRALGVSEDSDFFLEVVGKRVISEDIVDPKSPFKVWPALLQKRAVPVDVNSLTQGLPLWESEGRQWRFNPARLEDFGKEVYVDPTTIPSITQNEFVNALDKIQTKLTENPEAQNALDEITKVHNGDVPFPFEDLKTFALGYNGRSFLMSSLSKDSIEGAQLKCALNYIRSFPDEGEGLSFREVKLITFLMSVRACEIGQESGLTSYYQIYVPTDFKYSVTGDLFGHDHPEIQVSKYVFVNLMKEVVDSILNTDNNFMQGICGVTGNVPQLSHHFVYLKTLIGDKISVPLCRFDPSTAWLTDGLLKLSKEGGLRHFYEYILTNENLLKEAESKINQAVLIGNTYLQLRNLTSQWTYKDDENNTPQITRNGIAELFTKVGLLEEAFPGPACSSSSNFGGLTDDESDTPKIKRQRDKTDTSNIKRQRTRTGYQGGAV